MKQTQSPGFTLVELMITVVIIGIIAAVAYPSYTKHMVQTRRSDAQIALTRIAAQQERFYSDCGYYATTLVGTRACGTVGNATAVLGYDTASDLSPERHYQLSLAQGAITAAVCSQWNCGFTATANPNGAGTSTRQNGNGSLRIDSTGTRQWNKNGAGTWLRWTDK
jgi:type IV pilus assembly protein PilE